MGRSAGLEHDLNLWQAARFSRAAVRLAALPTGVTSRPLGELATRGKERALELYVLEASAAANRPDGLSVPTGAFRAVRQTSGAKGPAAA